VNRLVVGIEAHEAKQLAFERFGVGVGIVAGLLPFGDADAPVVDEIPNHVGRHVGQCRYRLGVLLDRVPNIHVSLYRIDQHKNRGNPSNGCGLFCRV